MPRYAVFINTIPDPMEDVMVFEGENAESNMKHFVHTKAHEDRYAEMIIKRWVVRKGSGFWRKLYRNPMFMMSFRYQRPPLRCLFRERDFYRYALNDGSLFTCTFAEVIEGSYKVHGMTDILPYKEFIAEYEQQWREIVEAGKGERITDISFYALYKGIAIEKEWQKGENA